MILGNLFQTLLRHVLQNGGGNIWSILSPKSNWTSSLCRFILEKSAKTGLFGNYLGVLFLSAPLTQLMQKMHLKQLNKTIVQLTDINKSYAMHDFTFLHPYL